MDVWSELFKQKSCLFPSFLLNKMRLCTAITHFIGGCQKISERLFKPHQPLRNSLMPSILAGTVRHPEVVIFGFLLILCHYEQSFNSFTQFGFSTLILYPKGWATDWHPEAAQFGGMSQRYFLNPSTSSP